MLLSYLRQLGSRAEPSVGPPVPELVVAAEEDEADEEADEEDEEDEEDDDALEVDEDEEEEDEELIQLFMLSNLKPLTHSRQTLVKALDLKQLAGKFCPAP
jgi:hypothetical protein